ncbi:MAG: Ig-like domain-containing protein [Anaerolineales bacterium]|jgi:hypothetical protein
MKRILIHGLSLLALVASLGATADSYTGPQRTTTTYSWNHKECSYHASYDLAGPGGAGGCDLTLYVTPTDGCPGDVSGYFNPTACVGWPDTCSALGCSISSSSKITGCDEGSPGCTRVASTTTLPPATVSGTPSCGAPGNAGWCRGSPALNLSANEPLSGYVITGIESGTHGMLCSGSSSSLNCSWPFPEGTNSLNFWADSSYGDTSAMASAVMNVDTQPPTLSISQTGGTTGQNGWYTAGPVNLAASAGDSGSGLAGVSVRLDGGGWQPGTSLQVTADGAHTVDFRADDVAGNSAVQSASVKLDSQPPMLTLSIPPADGAHGWFKTSPVVANASATDATSGLAGSPSINGGGPSFTTSADGTYTLTAKASDNAGNTATATGTIQLDTTAPTLGYSFSIPAPDGQNGWYVHPVSVSPDCSDSGSGLSSEVVSLDGDHWSSSVDISTDGTYTVYGRTSDVAGNTASSTTTVRLDTTPPQSAFVSPAEGSTVHAHGVLEMTGATTDATSGPASAEITLDNGKTWQPLSLGTDGSWSLSWNTFKVPNGTYLVQVRATDKAGNQEHTAQVTVVVSNTPPSVSISPVWVIWGPAQVAIHPGSSPVKGARITVSDREKRWPDAVTDYGASDLPSSFTWLGRMGDGKIAFIGKYKVTVQVWDAYGNDAEAVGWVIIPLPPTRTPRPTPTATSTSTATPTPLPQPTRAPSATLLPPAATPAPVVVPKTPKTLRQPATRSLMLWPVLGFVALLAALASASLSDSRPRALHKLRKTLDELLGKPDQTI